MLRRGDTFKERTGWHTMVVLSDPSLNPDAVYVVNFSHWARNRDQSCVLHPGDHGTISGPTIIYYNNTFLESAEAIEAKIRAKKYVQTNPVRKDVLARILAGAAISRKIPRKCLELLYQQGLLPRPLPPLPPPPPPKVPDAKPD